MSKFTIIQPFSLIFAKEEKLGRILPNKIKAYNEFSVEYVSVKMF